MSRYLPITQKDWIRHPLATVLRLVIWLYGHTLSGLVGRHCRHVPTCSEYADEALKKHGALRGGWLSLARVASCHPWSQRCSHDPVP